MLPDDTLLFRDDGICDDLDLLDILNKDDGVQLYLPVSDNKARRVRRTAFPASLPRPSEDRPCNRGAPEPSSLREWSQGSGTLSRRTTGSGSIGSASEGSILDRLHSSVPKEAALRAILQVLEKRLDQVPPSHACQDTEAEAAGIAGLGQAGRVRFAPSAGPHLTAPGPPAVRSGASAIRRDFQRGNGAAVGLRASGMAMPATSVPRVPVARSQSTGRALPSCSCRFRIRPHPPGAPCPRCGRSAAAIIAAAPRLPATPRLQRTPTQSSCPALDPEDCEPYANWQVNHGGPAAATSVCPGPGMTLEGCASAAAAPLEGLPRVVLVARLREAAGQVAALKRSETISRQRCEYLAEAARAGRSERGVATRQVEAVRKLTMQHEEQRRTLQRRAENLSAFLRKEKEAREAVELDLAAEKQRSYALGVQLAGAHQQLKHMQDLLDEARQQYRHFLDTNKQAAARAARLQTRLRRSSAALARARDQAAATQQAWQRSETTTTALRRLVEDLYMSRATGQIGHALQEQLEELVQQWQRQQPQPTQPQRQSSNPLSDLSRDTVDSDIPLTATTTSDILHRETHSEPSPGVSMDIEGTRHIENICSTRASVSGFTCRPNSSIAVPTPVPRYSDTSISTGNAVRAIPVRSVAAPDAAGNTSATAAAAPAVVSFRRRASVRDPDLQHHPKEQRCLGATAAVPQRKTAPRMIHRASAAAVAAAAAVVRPPGVAGNSRGVVLSLEDAGRHTVVRRTTEGLAADSGASAAPEVDGMACARFGGVQKVQLTPAVFRRVERKLQAARTGLSNRPRNDAGGGGPTDSVLGRIVTPSSRNGPSSSSGGGGGGDIRGQRGCSQVGGRIHDDFCSPTGSAISAATPSQLYGHADLALCTTLTEVSYRGATDSRQGQRRPWLSSGVADGRVAGDQKPAILLRDQVGVAAVAALGRRRRRHSSGDPISSAPARRILSSSSPNLARYAAEDSDDCSEKLSGQCNPNNDNYNEKNDDDHNACDGIAGWDCRDDASPLTCQALLADRLMSRAMVAHRTAAAKAAALTALRRPRVVQRPAPNARGTLSLRQGRQRSAASAIAAGATVVALSPGHQVSEARGSGLGLVRRLRRVRARAASISIRLAAERNRAQEGLDMLSKKMEEQLQQQQQQRQHRGSAGGAAGSAAAEDGGGRVGLDGAGAEGVVAAQAAAGWRSSAGGGAGSRSGSCGGAAMNIDVWHDVRHNASDVMRGVKQGGYDPVLSDSSCSDEGSEHNVPEGRDTPVKRLPLVHSNHQQGLTRRTRLRSVGSSGRATIAVAVTSRRRGRCGHRAVTFDITPASTPAVCSVQPRQQRRRDVIIDTATTPSPSECSWKDDYHMNTKASSLARGRPRGGGSSSLPILDSDLDSCPPSVALSEAPSLGAVLAARLAAAANTTAIATTLSPRASVTTTVSTNLATAAATVTAQRQRRLQEQLGFACGAFTAPASWCAPSASASASSLQSPQSGRTGARLGDTASQDGATVAVASSRSAGGNSDGDRGGSEGGGNGGGGWLRRRCNELGARGAYHVPFDGTHHTVSPVDDGDPHGKRIAHDGNSDRHAEGGEEEQFWEEGEQQLWECTGGGGGGEGTNARRMSGVDRRVTDPRGNAAPVAVPPDFERLQTALLGSRDPDRAMVRHVDCLLSAEGTDQEFPAAFLRGPLAAGSSGEPMGRIHGRRSGGKSSASGDAVMAGGGGAGAHDSPLSSLWQRGAACVASRDDGSGTRPHGLVADSGDNADDGVSGDGGYDEGDGEYSSYEQQHGPCDSDGGGLGLSGRGEVRWVQVPTDGGGDGDAMYDQSRREAASSVDTSTNTPSCEATWVRSKLQRKRPASSLQLTEPTRTSAVSGGSAATGDSLVRVVAEGPGATRTRAGGRGTGEVQLGARSQRSLSLTPGHDYGGRLRQCTAPVQGPRAQQMSRNKPAVGSAAVAETPTPPRTHRHRAAAPALPAVNSPGTHIRWGQRRQAAGSRGGGGGSSGGHPAVTAQGHARGGALPCTGSVPRQSAAGAAVISKSRRSSNGGGAAALELREAYQALKRLQQQ